MVVTVETCSLLDGTLGPYEAARRHAPMVSGSAVANARLVRQRCRPHVVAEQREGERERHPCEGRLGRCKTGGGNG